MSRSVCRSVIDIHVPVAVSNSQLLLFSPFPTMDSEAIPSMHSKGTIFPSEARKRCQKVPEAEADFTNADNIVDGGDEDDHASGDGFWQGDVDIEREEIEMDSASKLPFTQLADEAPMCASVLPAEISDPNSYTRRLFPTSGTLREAFDGGITALVPLKDLVYASSKEFRVMMKALRKRTAKELYRELPRSLEALQFHAFPYTAAVLTNIETRKILDIYGTVAAFRPSVRAEMDHLMTHNPEASVRERVVESLLKHCFPLNTILYHACFAASDRIHGCRTQLESLKSDLEPFIDASWTAKHALLLADTASCSFAGLPLKPAVDNLHFESESSAQKRGTTRRSRNKSPKRPSDPFHGLSGVQPLSMGLFGRAVFSMLPNRPTWDRQAHKLCKPPSGGTRLDELIAKSRDQLRDIIADYVCRIKEVEEEHALVEKHGSASCLHPRLTILNETLEHLRQTHRHLRSVYKSKRQKRPEHERLVDRAMCAKRREKNLTLEFVRNLELKRLEEWRDRADGSHERPAVYDDMAKQIESQRMRTSAATSGTVEAENDDKESVFSAVSTTKTEIASSADEDGNDR